MLAEMDWTIFEPSYLSKLLSIHDIKLLDFFWSYQNFGKANHSILFRFYVFLATTQ